MYLSQGCTVLLHILACIWYENNQKRRENTPSPIPKKKKKKLPLLQMVEITNKQFTVLLTTCVCTRPATQCYTTFSTTMTYD